MTILLECETNQTKQRWLLRSGESARVGSSPWVECSVATDPDLHPEHFEIRYDTPIQVHALQEATLVVNGLPQPSLTLESSGSWNAGRSRFHVQCVHPSTSGRLQKHELTEKVETPWQMRYGLDANREFSASAFQCIESMPSLGEALDNLRATEQLWESYRLAFCCLENKASIGFVFECFLPLGRPLSQTSQTQFESCLKNPSPERASVIRDSLPACDRNHAWTWLCTALAWLYAPFAAPPSAPIMAPSHVVRNCLIASLQLAPLTFGPRALLSKWFDELKAIVELNDTLARRNT